MVTRATARRPNLFRRAFIAAATALGYHAIDTTRNRRQVSASNLKTEDETLKRADREKLIETSRDADRNWAIARWMVNRHLDFVTTQNFHCRTKDKGLRATVETYIADRQRPAACDAARRDNLDTWIRTAESRAVLDGDIFGVRLESGQLQGIESVFCRNPGRRSTAYPVTDRWVNGVYQDDAGAPLAYCFHGRRTGHASDEEIVPAARVMHHGYFHRFHQARGVGLITPGLATLVDTYEICDYAVAKAKVAQLFALAVYRTGPAPAAPTYAVATSTATGTTTDTAATVEGSRYEVDFGKGPQFLDLEPGERAEFLSTQTPGIDPQFLRTLLIVTLSALDLPYCWLDASDANFFGNRGALILYLNSARPKRRRIIDLRNDWTEWQLTRAFADGTLDRPREPLTYVWQPAGVPFWNPAQEVNANLDAVDGCLTTRRAIVEETLGKDWDDLLDELEYEHNELTRRGLLKDRAGKLQPTVAPALAADVDPDWQRKSA